jgi:Derlin-2/3
MPFLASPLIFMMVYVWARRNPSVVMSFLGLFNFMAPYLPWVLFGLSFLVTNAFPLGDFIGIIVGHLYYYLKDVAPVTANLRPLKTPVFM